MRWRSPDSHASRTSSTDRLSNGTCLAAGRGRSAPLPLVALGRSVSVGLVALPNILATKKRRSPIKKKKPSKNSMSATLGDRDVVDVDANPTAGRQTVQRGRGLCRRHLHYVEILRRSLKQGLVRECCSSGTHCRYSWRSDARNEHDLRHEVASPSEVQDEIPRRQLAGVRARARPARRHHALALRRRD